MISAGGPTASGAPPPGTSTTRSAKGRTRSSRCSARSTVRPRSWTEPRQRVQHLLGRGGVERGRGLVEDQHAGRRREHRPDRHPLLLAPRERAHGPVPQIVQPEQVDRVLDAPAHRVGCHTEVLHGVRQLVLHPLGDEARERVLADEADDIGELARRVLPGRSPVDGHRAAEACRR